MACSIDYLRQRYSGDKLRVLANHHYQLKDELADSKLFRKLPDGSLTFFKDKLVPEAIAKIGSINARYRNYIPANTKIAFMNGTKLTININPIVDYILAENDANEKYQQEKSVQDLNQLEEIFMYEAGRSSDTGANAADTDETNKKVTTYFTKVIDDLKKAIITTKQSLKEKPYAKGYLNKLSELEEIIRNKDELHVIMNYISNSAAQLRAARNQFDAIKAKYKDPSSLTQSEISDFDERLNEIREFLHFYTNLEQISTIIKENNLSLQEPNKQHIKDEYFGVLLTPELEQVIDEVDLSSVSSVDIFFKQLKVLDPTNPHENVELIRTYINYLDKEKLTVDQKLEQALDDQALIVKDFQDYFVNLTAEWLFPYIDKTNQSLLTKGKTADIISKDKLKILLKRASKDTSFFGRHLGATISSNDPVTAAVALALKELIYQAKSETDDTIYELTELYSQKVTGENSESIHESYLRNAYVRTGTKDEQGNPIYRTIPAFHEEFYHDIYEKDFFQFKLDLKRQLDSERAKLEKENEVFLALPSNTKGNLRYTPDWIDDYIEKRRKSAMRNWYEEKTALRADAIAFLDKKKASMTPKRFENWIRSNSVVLENKSYTDEEGIHFTKDLFEESGKVIPDVYLDGLSIRDNYFVIFSGDFIVPKGEKYLNKTFEKLKKDAYFSKLYSVYKDSNTDLPQLRRLPFGIIPQDGKKLSFKESYLDDDGKPSKEKLVNYISSAWEAEDDEVEIKEQDEFGEEQLVKVSKIRQRVDGSIVRNIPIRYTVLFDDPSKLNKNLLETVSLFASASANYKNLSKLEPNVELLRTIINGDEKLKIQARQVNETNAKGNQIVSFFSEGVPNYLVKEKQKGIRINEMLIEFINDVMYGEEEQKESLNLFGRDISLNKLGNNLGFITSLYSMAGNFTAGINNLLVGNINSFSESIGGRYYTPDDWASAKREYYRLLGTGAFFNDLAENNWNKKSLITQFQLKFDAIQGEFLDTRGKIQTGSLLNKLLAKDSLFFIQHATEHEIQMTSMIAMLKGYKLINGTFLFDAYETGPTGKIKLKAGYEGIVTPEVEQDFRNQLHAINKQHHGNYNKFDKASLQRKWYGKLALIFRKYIYTSFKARLGGYTVDYELGDTTEGYYSVSAKIAVKFFSKLRSDISTNQAFMLKKYFTETLTADEQYALKKTATELAFLAVANMIILGLSALDLDDDDDFLNSVHLQSKRIQQDLLTFIPPWSFSPLLRLFTNPSAAFNIIDKINDFIQQLVSDPFGEYSRSSGYAEKGDSKLWIKFQKILPIWRQYIKLVTPEEQLKYYDLLKSGK